MSDLVKEVSDIANKLIAQGWELSSSEAIQCAARIQHNRILEDAFMVNKGENTPVALESIAMELGASMDGDNIKSALFRAAEAMEAEL